MAARSTNESSSSADLWQDFIAKAEMFAGQTSQHAQQGINPGGDLNIYL